jgi:hypothetical protein
LARRGASSAAGRTTRTRWKKGKTRAVDRLFGQNGAKPACLDTRDLFPTWTLPRSKTATIFVLAVSRKESQTALFDRPHGRFTSTGNFVVSADSASLSGELPPPLALYGNDGDMVEHTRGVGRTAEAFAVAPNQWPGEACETIAWVRLPAISRALTILIKKWPGICHTTQLETSLIQSVSRATNTGHIYLFSAQPPFLPFTDVSGYTQWPRSAIV